MLKQKIDWLMPYDEDTGEVYDTELSFLDVTEAEQAAAYRQECGEYILRKYIEKEEE